MGRCLEVRKPKEEIPYKFRGNNSSFLLILLKLSGKAFPVNVDFLFSVFLHVSLEEFSQLQFLLGKDLPFKK